MKYTLFEGPCAFVFAFLALIPLALVGAFSALFMCRANGLLGLYFGDRMELVNEQIGGVPVGFGPRYVAFLTDLTMVPLTSFLIVKNRTAMMVIWLCNALILVVVIFDPGPLYLMLVGCLNIGVTFWMYHCLMEAGYEQCTIGKNALGIIVVAAGTKASRISMKQGTIRFLGKIVSMLILGGGYLMVLFDKNKQTLHDKMAGTQVVWRGDESKM